MDWQLPLALLVTAVAVAYLARQAWRTWRGRKAGCGGCRCTPAAPPSRLIPPEQIQLRR